MVKGNVSTQSPRVHSHRNFPSNTKGPSINYGPVHLIRPPSKTHFKAPFKAPFRHKTQALEAYVVNLLKNEESKILKIMSTLFLDAPNMTFRHSYIYLCSIFQNTYGVSAIMLLKSF